MVVSSYYVNDVLNAYKPCKIDEMSVPYMSIILGLQAVRAMSFLFESVDRMDGVILYFIGLNPTVFEDPLKSDLRSWKVLSIVLFV